MITGGAGFIGSNFLEEVFYKRQDLNIIVLDLLTYAGRIENIPPEIWQSKRFKFIKGDIRNQKLVNQLVAKSNLVIHFAAESHVARSIPSPKRFFDVNVMGTHVLTDAVTKNKKNIEKFIHISTCEVYGEALEEKISENHPLNPTTPYAASKAAADSLAYAYYKTYDIPLVIIRPFNGFGPKQYIEKVIPKFITNALEGKPLTIHGSGRQSRDWTYVKDQCQGYLKIMELPISKVKGEVINLGSSQVISIEKIARLILKELKKPKALITYIKDRPGQVQYFKSSSAKAEKLFHWQPKTSFEQGLKKTIRWYQKNKNWWRPIRKYRDTVVKIDKQKIAY